MVTTCLCMFRLDQVIVHVGCMSIKDSQELVSTHFSLHALYAFYATLHFSSVIRIFSSMFK